MRRRRTRRRGSRTWIAEQLRTPRLDWYMAAAAALLFVVSAHEFHSRLGYYPDVSLGWTPAEMTYAYGQPQRREGDDRWIYQRDGTELVVGFGGGQVDRVQCRMTAAVGNCPPIFGIGSRGTEEQIWRSLGAPETQAFAGNTKMVTFEPMGLSYELSQFEVRGATLEHRSHMRPGFLFHYIRAILPG